MRRYIIYCDESEDKGEFFSNFYGGVLIRGTDIKRVEDTLRRRLEALGIAGEVKWTKTTTLNYPKHIALMETFFDLVGADLVKVRIFFTQNAYKPLNLDPHNRKNAYFLLYYQFLKHAFGLPFSNPTNERVRLQILFDEMPNLGENKKLFKEFLLRLQNQSGFRAAKIAITPDDLQEVTSHDHVILQCLDVVLGSMNFRLNNLHLKKEAGQTRRGKKTIVKERLYKYINRRLRGLRSGFNVGCTTSIDGDAANVTLIVIGDSCPAKTNSTPRAQSKKPRRLYLQGIPGKTPSRNLRLRERQGFMLRLYPLV